MNNICIDCKGETITEKGVIYVRRGKENVEICLSCWQKTFGRLNIETGWFIR